MLLNLKQKNNLKQKTNPMKNQMSETEKKLILKKIEKFSQKGLIHQRDVIISGFWTDEGQGYEVLCFIGGDLVFYKELTPPTQIPGYTDHPLSQYFNSSNKVITLNGINNEVDFMLLDYLENTYSNDMNKFENDFGRDSKFVHYIKNNLKEYYTTNNI